MNPYDAAGFMAFHKHILFLQDFNIVDTSDSQVFIAVDHEENIANLYLSDVTGQYYVTSMENVVGLRVPGKYDVDIVKVKPCGNKINLY